MMSYAEKPEDITREEWMEKLNNVHIQRADMNRLIMNYLVTGTKCCLNFFFYIYCMKYEYILQHTNHYTVNICLSPNIIH